MKVGSKILLKYGCQLIQGIVIDVDLSFITVRFEYKKGKHCDIKIKNTRDALKIDGIDLEAFEYKNDVFRA